MLVLGPLAVAGGFAAGTSAQEGEPETPVPEETATPPATPTASPTFAAPITYDDKQPTPGEQPPQHAFGMVEAEPHRVYTGDGECLNVRPQPGTLFGGDPRTCVPEGFLLWLYGPAKDVDGMTWRYALGQGWVATQYVQPASDAAAGMDPFSSVVVTQQAGSGTASARVHRSGAVEDLPWLPYFPEGLGAQPAATSPDGRWIAYTRWDGPAGPQLTILDTTTNFAQSYPNLSSLGWSVENKLLVNVSANCATRGCTNSLGWVRPTDGAVNPIPGSNDFWGAWTPDGQSVIGQRDGNTIVFLGMDGTRREVAVDIDEGGYLGELTVSPDGTKVLSVSFLGDVRVIDLDSGRMRVLSRAPQLDVGGKCGGSTGKLSAWLDDNTVVWHESYAPKGQNGITIATLDGGIQRVIPFFTIQDLKVPAPGLISFTTWEYADDKPLPQLSWLLDTSTGEARPVAIGAFPTWER